MSNGKAEDFFQDYAVVFAGGGAKGAWEIGVWQALEERGIKPALVVSGTSVGALNAALYSQQDFGRALEIWQGINTKKLLGDGEKSPWLVALIDKMFKDNSLIKKTFYGGTAALLEIVPFFWYSLLKHPWEDIIHRKSGLHSQGIFSARGLKDLIQGGVPVDSFKIPTYACVYDKKKHGVSYVELRKLNLEWADRMKYLQASASIPIVYPEVVVDDKRLCDGGCGKSIHLLHTKLFHFQWFKKEEIDNVPVRPIKNHPEIKKVLVIGLCPDEITQDVFDSFSGLDVFPICPNKPLGNPLDFSQTHVEALLREGKEMATKWIDKVMRNEIESLRAEKTIRVMSESEIAFCDALQELCDKSTTYEGIYQLEKRMLSAFRDNVDKGESLQQMERRINEYEDWLNKTEDAFEEIEKDESPFLSKEKIERLREEHQDKFGKIQKHIEEGENNAKDFVLFVRGGKSAPKHQKEYNDGFNGQLLTCCQDFRNMLFDNMSLQEVEINKLNTLLYFLARKDCLEERIKRIRETRESGKIALKDSKEHFNISFRQQVPVSYDGPLTLDTDINNNFSPFELTVYCHLDGCDDKKLAHFQCEDTVPYGIGKYYARAVLNFLRDNVNGVEVRKIDKSAYAGIINHAKWKVKDKAYKVNVKTVRVISYPSDFWGEIHLQIFANGESLEEVSKFISPKGFLNGKMLQGKGFEKGVSVIGFIQKILDEVLPCTKVREDGLRKIVVVRLDGSCPSVENDEMAPRLSNFSSLRDVCGMANDSKANVQGQLELGAYSNGRRFFVNELGTTYLLNSTKVNKYTQEQGISQIYAFYEVLFLLCQEYNMQQKYGLLSPEQKSLYETLKKFIETPPNNAPVIESLRKALRALLQ